MFMIFIISESQQKILIESIIPSWFRRRTDKETLKKYVNEGELQYPTLCEYFSSPHEYSENVIEWAIDQLVEEYESHTDSYFTDSDSYPDTLDYFKNILRENFEEYLINVYIETCYNN